MVSNTVTVVDTESILPEASLTLNQTVLAPVSLHVKFVLLAMVAATAQLSVEPLLILLAVMLVVPEAFK